MKINLDTLSNADLAGEFARRRDRFLDACRKIRTLAKPPEVWTDQVLSRLDDKHPAAKTHRARLREYNEVIVASRLRVGASKTSEEAITKLTAAA